MLDRTAFQLLIEEAEQKIIDLRDDGFFKRADRLEEAVKEVKRYKEEHRV